MSGSRSPVRYLLHRSAKALRGGLARRLRTAYVGRAWRRLPPAQRRRIAWEDAPLQLDNLFEIAVRWTDSPADILHDLGFTAPSSIAEELRAVTARLEARCAEVELRFPVSFKIGDNSRALLYSLIRQTRPEVVVETGIADGWSTALILAAMDANGTGALHSVDVDQRTGILVETEHPRWYRHITDGSRNELAELLAQLPPLDLFLHDSDHSYRVQADEYSLATSSLRAGGLLLSDDVNWSNAFLDYCKDHRCAPWVLADPNKLTGVARVPTGLNANAEVQPS